jgi:predicted RNA binding protein YcfA (HicA-like mRNA interferase family)
VTISKFPVDAPKQKVVKALQALGFRVIREKEHISLERTNADGTKTPMTIPNHDRIKSSTLRTICTQASISREEFLKAYERA